MLAVSARLATIAREGTVFRLKSATADTKDRVTLTDTNSPATANSGTFMLPKIVGP